jgi:hypothetical protein
MTLSVAQPVQCRTERWSVYNLLGEQTEVCSYGLIWGIISAVMDWGKQKKNCQDSRCPAEIRTEQFMNKSQKSCRLDHLEFLRVELPVTNPQTILTEARGSRISSTLRRQYTADRLLCSHRYNCTCNEHYTVLLNSLTLGRYYTASVWTFAYSGIFQSYYRPTWSRDSSVGIATGRGVGVRFLAGEIHLPLLHSMQPSSAAHSASYRVGAGGTLTRGKAVGVWSWPVTSTRYWGKEWWSCTSTPHTSSWSGA